MKLFSGASVIILLLLSLIELASALQQCPLHALSYRQPIRFCRPTSHLLSSAAVVEEPAALTRETPLTPSEWEEQFEELLLFKAEHGHCNFPPNPPARLQKDYPRLAGFLDNQRLEYSRMEKKKRRKSLSLFDRSIRCRQLEEIGVDFNFDGDFQWNSRRIVRNRIDWMDMYKQLADFHKRHGHFRVQRTLYPSLNSWIYKQRLRRRGRRDPPLSNEQICLLDDIGFEWESNILYDSQWHAKYKELVAFKNTHGHLFVNQRDDKALSFWIKNQRRSRAGKRTVLSDEQIRLLDDIGFPWEPECRDVKWRASYEKLVHFQKNHGHCKPSHATNKSLNQWSYGQRKKRKNGLLSKEQIKLLDEIDFQWESNANKWAVMYRELIEFCNENGHLQTNREDAPDLDDWVTVQRERYHERGKRRLSDGQIEKLEDIDFCWSLDWRERSWHAKYTEAVEFYKQHGHVRVSKKSNASLWYWIQTQGKRYKEMKGQKPLMGEELELLEQIDFDFLQDHPRLAWNRMYEEMERYRKENENHFPSSHKDDQHLCRWVRQQRRRLRGEYGYVPLSSEQRSLLESIDFPMHSRLHIRCLWNEQYDELVDFWKQNGHFLVDRDQNPTLWKWISYQRVRYNRTSIIYGDFPLTRSQIYLLDRIGFPWTSDRLDREWQMVYDELVQFLEENARFPGCLAEDPKLYRWMEKQRGKYKGMESPGLSKHQIDQLEKIGFRWSMRD